MSLRRLGAVLRLDLALYLRRPLFWFLLGLLVLLAWGLAAGNARIGAGDSSVGGKRAWLTSEFSVAQMLSVEAVLLYGLFAAIAAGMAIIRDDELRIGEILHATPLRAGEYVWGKFLAVCAAVGLVLAVHMAATVALSHGLPRDDAEQVRGPLVLANYLWPVVAFAIPSILFFLGTSFAIGTITRKPILVFVVPVAVLLACVFLLWTWTPSWLDPRIDRVLMLVDPSGLRWLSQTWLADDRGVDFYNLQPIPLDGGFVASRFAFVAFALGAVALSARSFAATLRGSSRVARGARKPAAVARTAEVVERPLSGGPHATAPGWLRGTLEIARVEARGLVKQPGLYLFVPLIVLEVVANSMTAVGAFDTPILDTPGLMAVAAAAPLTFLGCLLLLFYVVEAHERERASGLDAIHRSLPIRTASVVVGKALACSLVPVALFVFAFVSCAIVLVVQGHVALDAWPFALVWGGLLLPTLLLWIAFVSAVAALTRSRFASYAIGLLALAATGYHAIQGNLDWATNWPLWGALRWSDIGPFGIDREVLVWNRIAAVAGALFFLWFAVRVSPRAERDAVRSLHRLRPGALARAALPMLAVAALPVSAVIVTGVLVRGGFQGGPARRAVEDYWRRNLHTWKDAPQPDIAGVDLDVEFDPARRWFCTKGSYELVNEREKPLASFALTGGLHWTSTEWTLDGAEAKPEDRNHLFVFELPSALEVGERVRVGFEVEGVYPMGASRNGGGVANFILPDSVVVTSFGPDIAPIVGYFDGAGPADRAHAPEPRTYPKDHYVGITRPFVGSPAAYTTRIRVTGPADFTWNGAGVLESEEVRDGKRTAVWTTDYPVRFFNVVGGRWDVSRGEGVAVYYHPEHAVNVPEMTRVLAEARRWYSEWFHPFPWRELKLSEFADHAQYAQGFASNITFSEGIGFLTESEPKTNLVFLVTAHETAHQWWGNLLCPGEGPGGNILSEGMAHFSTILLADQVLGERGRIEFCMRIESRYGDRRHPDAERWLLRIDGSKDGDTTVMYDKGGWVFWMLLQRMGREACLAGLQAFIAKYETERDRPVLEDFLAHMRGFAPDTAAFDDFEQQWFRDVVVPEYRFVNARRERVDGAEGGERWRVTVTVTNVGTGRMPIEVGALRGERFDDAGAPDPSYRDARTSTVLGENDSHEVTIECDFEPDRLVVDPDVRVLQLRRKHAVVRF